MASPGSQRRTGEVRSEAFTAEFPKRWALPMLQHAPPASARADAALLLHPRDDGFAQLAFEDLADRTHGQLGEQLEALRQLERRDLLAAQEFDQLAKRE